MTMDEPPGKTSRVFDSLDEGVPDFGAVLSSEVELIKPDEILANGFVYTISDEEPGHVRGLNLISQ